MIEVTTSKLKETSQQLDSKTQFAVKKKQTSRLHPSTALHRSLPRPAGKPASRGASGKAAGGEIRMCPLPERIERELRGAYVHSHERLFLTGSSEQRRAGAQQLLRGRRIVFVGDSTARRHMWAIADVVGAQRAIRRRPGAAPDKLGPRVRDKSGAYYGRTFGYI